MNPPETIVCVDCGGICHLISFMPDEEPPEPGMVVSYRCGECGERFDMVWEPEE